MATSLAQVQPIGPSTDKPQHIDSSSPYRGPSMPWLLSNHKFAEQVIGTHSAAPANILDGHELALLRDYVRDPAAGRQLLREADMLDEGGNKAGTRANVVHGSLAGFVIASGALDEREVGLLREWFASPGMEEELRGVERARGGRRY